MQCFTIDGTRHAGAGIEISTIELGFGPLDCVVLGEEGRGRQLAFVPVAGGPPAGELIHHAKLGVTRRGAPKLIVCAPAHGTGALVLMLSSMGYRGGNAHTGDFLEKQGGLAKFADFPGEIIATGQIAQGIAGCMGSGTQIFAHMRAGDTWRIKYYGRMYGAVGSIYYHYDGAQILQATMAERDATDIF